MSAVGAVPSRKRAPPPPTLAALLEPEVLADPYPLYRQLREHDPVLWDPLLHAWVVTRYADVVTVLMKLKADRTPTPEQLRTLGLGELEPIAQVMVRQMLFMDPPSHTRLRGLCSAAFTSRRVDQLQGHIRQIAHDLIDRVAPSGRMDVIADFANKLPAIVTAELLGVPTADHEQLKLWSADFAEMLGNFQHNPDRAAGVLRSTSEMGAYFASAIAEHRRQPRPGLLGSLLEAEIDGARLSDDEVIANVIVTMVGGQETTTNLIGSGLLTLLRQPDKLAQLRDYPEIVDSAVEELLRYESPSQHTARIATPGFELGGKGIRAGDAVLAVMAAANRDPARFEDPDTLDLLRTDNRHLAFGWAAHFCFGAPLARIEGRIAFDVLLQRLPGLRLVDEAPAWRENLGLRGLLGLDVAFAATGEPPAPSGLAA